jgi:hypothetical protein
MEIDRDTQRQSLMEKLEEVVRKRHSKPCIDCGMETFPVNSWESAGNGGYRINVNLNTAENFLLWDDVWVETGLAFDGGSLCVGCTEKRLGRKLKAADFQFGNNGYNIPDLATERLLSRMLPRGVRRKVLSDNKGKSITMLVTKEDMETA